MEINQWRIRSGLIFSVLLFGLLVASPGWAEIECGDVIQAGEVAKVNKDLFCSGFNPALTMEGNAILDLGGHKVDCEDPGPNPVGIQMNGGGAILQYGTVMKCARAVVVAGQGANIIHKVKVIDSTFNGFRVEAGSGNNVVSYCKAVNSRIGFFFASDGNEARYNTARDNSLAGFSVAEGNHNSLKHNYSKGNIIGFDVRRGNENWLYKNLADSNDVGIDIQGQGNRVAENIAKNSGQLIAVGATGIRLRDGSSDTQVLGNIAKKNKKFGIHVEEGAINGTFLGNLGVRNGDTDLVDDHVDCDGNIWQGNFGSRNRDCIH